MKVGPAERRRVAALADRYFAEQCARLGPIAGTAVAARKRSPTLDKLARLSDEAGAKVATKQTFTKQHLGSHGHDVRGTEMADRFRL